MVRVGVNARNPCYDVTPDRQRFLQRFLVLATTEDTNVRVILNWLDELERLVPADR